MTILEWEKLKIGDLLQPCGSKARKGLPLHEVMRVGSWHKWVEVRQQGTTIQFMINALRRHQFQVMYQQGALKL